MAKKATQKARNLKNNRRRGNSYEVKIAKELRELGFTGVVTSRSESKAMDDKKVDFIDTENKLPVYLQAKKTIQTPNYLKIQSECPLKDKPFVII
jgi:Holliday junction resolvase